MSETLLKVEKVLKDLFTKADERNLSGLSSCLFNLQASTILGFWGFEEFRAGELCFFPLP